MKNAKFSIKVASYIEQDHSNSKSARSQDEKNMTDNRSQKKLTVSPMASPNASKLSNREQEDN